MADPDWIYLIHWIDRGWSGKSTLKVLVPISAVEIRQSADLQNVLINIMTFSGLPMSSLNSWYMYSDYINTTYFAFLVLGVLYGLGDFNKNMANTLMVTLQYLNTRPSISLQYMSVMKTWTKDWPPSWILQYSNSPRAQWLSITYRHLYRLY